METNVLGILVTSKNIQILTYEIICFVSLGRRTEAFNVTYVHQKW
jgi:hypothetical protein